MSDSRQVHPLSLAHADGIRRLCMEPDVAAAAGLGVSPSADQVLEYIATATKAREEGRSYVFVLANGSEVSGICRLIGAFGVPRLLVAIGHAYRDQGNGSFLVRHVLAFAFETLELERVTATGACLRLVSQFARSESNGITRQEWLAAGSEASENAARD